MWQAVVHTQFNTTLHINQDQFQIFRTGLINQTGQKVYVKITDTGIGIPDSDLQKIFNKNYRSDISKQLNISGSGLGLAIAKDFAEDREGTQARHL